MSAQHSFDTIIIGGGAMGSAAAWQLSARGQRVLVLDRFRPPHSFGSTHGETRVIREAYFEHPAYVPLVQRAYELWRQLEELSGESLLKITGGLMIGPTDGVVFNGALASARAHNLPHETLDASAVSRRFPALRIPAEFRAVFEPRAGMLYVERCVAAFLKLAAANGAVLKFGERVTRWRSNDAVVEVVTDQAVYSAQTLVVAAGAWLPKLLPELAGLLKIERQVLHWFRPVADTSDCLPDRLPVHVCEYERGRFYYALPDVGAGVKAALHHQGETVSADDPRREASDAERDLMSALVGRFLPALRGLPHQSTTCLYTNTPDEHFLIDHHPAHSNVLIVSPCSGHGFKFASAIGELVADLATSQSSRLDLSLFKLARFDCR